MKIAAYADPPYIGQARKHYDREEVDHRELIEKLWTFDGWALSASSPSMWEIMPLIGQPVRIGVWVKPFCIYKPGVNPAYAWEPVFYVPVRKRTRQQETVRDFVSANVTLRRGLSGVKPDQFSVWLFEILGLEPSDGFEDLFPGSGAVTRAWETWRQMRLANAVADATGSP